MTQKAHIEVTFAPGENKGPFTLYLKDDNGREIDVDLSRLEVLKLINSALAAFISADKPTGGE